jgi:hypothetical protein
MHQDVAAAEFPLDGVAQLVDIGFGGLIAANRNRVAAALLDALDSLRGVGNVGDGHRGALCRQSLAEGLPDAVGSSGDDCALVGRHVRRSPVCFAGHSGAGRSNIQN